MRRLATLPARRLWAIAAVVVLVAAGGGIAQAALSGAPTPEPKPLNAAIRDAVNAPAVTGITARIAFTCCPPARRGAAARRRCSPAPRAACGSPPGDALGSSSSPTRATRRSSPTARS
jgi:hypothetical protein